MELQVLTLKNSSKAAYFGLNDIFIALKLFDEPVVIEKALKDSREDAKDLEQRLKKAYQLEEAANRTTCDILVEPMTLAQYVLLMRIVRYATITDTKDIIYKLLRKYQFLLDTQLEIEQEEKMTKKRDGKIVVTVYEHQETVDFNRRIFGANGRVARFYLSHFMPSEAGKGDFRYFIENEEGLRGRQIRAIFGGRSDMDFIDARYVIDKTHQNFFVPLVIYEDGAIYKRPYIIKLDQQTCIAGILQGLLDPNVAPKPGKKK